MTKTAQELLSIFKKFSKGTGSVICPVGKLAKMLGVCEKSIRNASKALVEMGYIQKVAKWVPDKRTGNARRIANEYILVEKFTGGDAGKFTGYKESFKRSIKKIKELKREEAAAGSTPSVVPISQNHTYENRQQITPQSIPTTADQVKQAMAPIIDRFNPAVVQHVIALYAKLLPTGHIGSPLGWLRGALNKEQERFEKFGYSGIKKRSKSMTYTNFLKAGGFEPEETFWANLINRQPYQAF